MRKLFFFITLLYSSSVLHGQVKVRIVVKEATAIKHDSIFIAGSFNNWDSTPNKNYMLRPSGESEHSVVLTLAPGAYRFKITRGSWFSVEKQFNSDEVPDHLFTVTKDTTIADTVFAWRDQIILDKWHALEKANSDTIRANLFTTMAYIYAFIPEWHNADSALYCAGQSLLALQRFRASSEFRTSTQKRYILLLIYNQEITATVLHTFGNYTKSLELRLDNLKLAETNNDQSVILDTYKNIIADYLAMKDHDKELVYSRKMLEILRTADSTKGDFPYYQRLTNLSMARVFYEMHEFDSALVYASRRFGFDSSSSQFSYSVFNAYNSEILGNIYAARSDWKLAFYYYKAALPPAFRSGLYHIAALSQKGIALYYQRQDRMDSALYYARLALTTVQSSPADVSGWGENINGYVLEITPLIASLYEADHQPDSAYKYLQLSVVLRDSLYNVDKIRQFQTLSFNESARQQQQLEQAKADRRQFESRLKIYGLIGGLVILLLVAVFLYRSNRQKQSTNAVLQQQKAEVENALDELKLTQAQLVQAEKMASLGELTAGIAHEIQNPLNFVNNFSELNTELIEELKIERLKSKNERDDHLEDGLLGDIEQNLQKINFHGKRADGIVKGMLQHSRVSSGQKELTDVNALLDEYFRLAYHGLRAKNKFFNAKMETDFDPSLPKINVVPQDVGRAFLNLINNAFYASSNKASALQNGSNEAGASKSESERARAVAEEPTVWVSTKKLGNRVEIQVRDNGDGIPESIKDKIFQPFFTTKPTGVGTGLGLSLTYDIIKSHAGNLNVESEAGKGATFVIQLPIT